MKKIILVYFLALGLILPSISLAAPILNPNNGHYYEVIDIVGSGGDCIIWIEGYEMAENSIFKFMQGHLATITSQEENDWLVQNFNLFDMWIGGFQNIDSPEYGEPAGGWEWITGEEWDYTNWLAGEPNNFGGDERHLDYYFGEKWADKSSCARGYVVEYEPTCTLNRADILKYYGVPGRGIDSAPGLQKLFNF